MEEKPIKKEEIKGIVKYVLRAIINIDIRERSFVDKILVKRKIYKKEEVGFWLRRNPNSVGPQYYVIRLNPYMGIGASLNICLGVWDYLKSKGYTPVVWMTENDEYDKEVLKNHPDKIINRWNYTMDHEELFIKALKSDNVYISSLNLKGCNMHPPKRLKKYYKYSTNTLPCINNGEDLFLYRKYSKDFFKPKKNIIRNADEFVKNNKIDMCLGVGMREQFSLGAYRKGYKKTRHQRYLEIAHPILPSVEESIEVVKERMKKWGYTKLFVSTLYEETIDKFEQSFGKENVIAYPRNRRSFDEYLNDEDGYRAKSKRKGAEEKKRIHIEYMEEMMILSQCDSLIVAKSGAIRLVGICKEKKYSHFDLFSDANENSLY